MKLSHRARPGAGFVLLAVTVSASVAFFAWGLRKPPLEVAWRLQIELGVGRREPLRDDEIRLFERALARHEGIAGAMLEDATAGLVSANARGLVENGYAYVVRRSPGAPALLEVTPAGFAIDDTVGVSVRVGTEALRSGPSTRAAPFSVAVPQSGTFPQLIEVRVTSSGKKKSGPPPVQVELRSPT